MAPTSPRQHAMRIARIGVSLALLVGMFMYAGVADTVKQIGELRTPIVLMALLILFSETIVRCFNWSQLCRAANLQISFGSITYSYFAGGFLGSFLPSTLSTDAVRSALAASRSSGSTASFLGTIVALNLASLWSVGVVGLAAAAWWWGHHTGGNHVVSLTVLTCLACVLLPMAVFVFLHSRYGDLTPGSFDQWRWAAKIIGIFQRFGRAIAILPNPRVLTSILAVAAATYALRTLVIFTLLLSADSGLPYADLLFLVPLLIIAAVLPISVGNFGGQQAATVYVLGQWGVSADSALAISLTYSVLYLALHGLGSLAYAFSRGKKLTDAAP